MRAILGIATVIMVPIGIIWWAYAATCIWSWLVVPTWEVPEITMMQALAAAVVRSLLFVNIEMQQHFQSSQIDRADTDEKMMRAIIGALLGPLFSIIFAAILSIFV